MSIPIGQLYAFLFLFTRASGIFIFTPFLGNFLVPVSVRILLSLSIGYLLSLASALPQIPTEMGLASLTLGLAGELAVGMVIGFAAHCIFAGLQYAGQLLGFQVGLSFVNTVDPQTSNRSTTLSIYMNFLGMMLFLGVKGHHWFIEALGKSLTILPPYSIRFTGSFIAHMTVLVGKIFVIGFQIAAPLLAVLLLTDVVLGIIGRSAPQVHIMIIGLPLKVLVGMTGMGLMLYFLPTAMRGYSNQMFREMLVFLQLMRA
jgi:flagellar biosynthetic protein FliR